MSQFRNLVFEGGGVKGIAYAGAVQVLESRGILGDIRRVGGTSAGAITAALLALGATSRDTERILAETDFRRFMDDSWGVVRDINRFLTQYGWFKGDEFAQWMRRQIASLADGHEEITFGELAAAPPGQAGVRRELYTVATDLTLQRAEVFSAETTPDIPVWLAVRMSMSIPLFFACVRSAEAHVVVDGGITWNYPIDLFDHPRYLAGSDARARAAPEQPIPGSPHHIYNKQTLGFRVDTSDEVRAALAAERHEPVKIANLMDYANVLLRFTVDTANRTHLRKEDWHRTVFIEAGGVCATDFGLSDEQVRMLVENGRAGTQRYFAWFEDPAAEEKPVNRAE
jgi:NTE family protein